jgi:hypothetical protein
MSVWAHHDDGDQAVGAAASPHANWPTHPGPCGRHSAGGVCLLGARRGPAVLLDVGHTGSLEGGDPIWVERPWRGVLSFGTIEG